MNQFLKNFAIVSVVVVSFLILMFHSVETAWEPIEKTGGSGTQTVGESDLVLPSGSEVEAIRPEQTIYDMEVRGMTDAEKVALIDAMLTDAFRYFEDVDDSQVWKSVAVCIDNVVKFGGEAQ